jgi:site-specific DNA recombinase
MRTRPTSSSTRAAAYVRVSTGRQADEGLSLDAQVEVCRAYVAAQGWELVDVYVERGVSGRKVERPELDRLLGALDGLDRVVIPRLDRLGRSAADLFAIFGAFEQAGVGLASIADGFDTATPAGRLLRTVLSAVAELESDNISERVKAVSVNRVREGKPHGRPPLGYEDRDGRRVVVPAEAEVVRRIFAAFDSGTPQLRIAQALDRDAMPTKRGGRWTQSHVQKVLSNPATSPGIASTGRSSPPRMRRSSTRMSSSASTPA